MAVGFSRLYYAVEDEKNKINRMSRLVSETLLVLFLVSCLLFLAILKFPMYVNTSCACDFASVCVILDYNLPLCQMPFRSILPIRCD